jgi:hypothetical protein
MKRKGSESWRMAIDIAEALQFAGYIAQREGFSIGEASDAKSILSFGRINIITESQITT